MQLKLILCFQPILMMCIEIPCDLADFVSSLLPIDYDLVMNCLYCDVFINVCHSCSVWIVFSVWPTGLPVV